MQWVCIYQKISKLEDKSIEINQVKVVGRWVSHAGNRASELSGTVSSGLHLLTAIQVISHGKEKVNKEIFFKYNGQEFFIVDKSFHQSDQKNKPQTKYKVTPSCIIISWKFKSKFLKLTRGKNAWCMKDKQ